MKILIVGAGAVGLVYARHLQRAGVAVSVFVKPKYVDECTVGQWMYPLNDGRDVKPERFVPDGVYCVPDVMPRDFDQIWLCMSSTAMRQPWLDEFLKHAGGATIVSLQPGLADREYLLERLPAARVVNGMIPFISYQTPLPGEDRAPAGVAYYVPPLTRCPFSGPRAAVDALVQALKAGGLGAKRVADVPSQLAFGSSLMMPVIAALEWAGWTFAELKRAPHLPVAIEAAREASAIAAPGKKRWLAKLIASGLGLRVVLWLGPKIMPFDLEVYLRYHFTKVGDQTRDALALYVRRGVEASLPVEALNELCDALT